MIVVAIIGILAAIAIPNFIRFQARSKQAEAKTNLRAVFTGQKSRFGERSRYSNALGDIGFAPERGNRYQYDLGAPLSAGGLACAANEVRNAAVAVQPVGTQACGVTTDTLRYPSDPADRTQVAGQGAVTATAATTGVAVVAPTSAGAGLGVIGVGCPSCSFAASAFGNIDNDPGNDLFFVSSEFLSVGGDGCAEASPNNQPGSPVLARNDVNCE
jgi:type IV pilus assembly protein PilA